MNAWQLLLSTWFFPLLRGVKKSSWGEKGRSMVMAAGFAAFLALLGGIFRPIVVYFWGQEAFGQVLVRGVIYFLFVALGILTAFSAVISMSSRFFTAADADIFLSRPVDERVYFKFRYWQGALATSWMILPFWIPLLYALRKASGAGLGFFAWGALAPLPLGWIASSLAAFLVMLAARRVSAQRLRRSFVVAAALLAVGLILMLRLIQPEKLTRPDAAVNLEQFIKTWSPSARLYDPVALATDTVILYFQDPWGAVFRCALLWALAAGLYFFLQRLSAPGFLKAWLASRELIGGLSRGPVASRLWAKGGGVFRLLWLKEASALLRNPILRLQLLLVGALCGIFLYNLYRLPFEDDPGLRNLLFLPACGFSQLILISVATRFIFPIESMESHGSWILRVAPVPKGAWLASRIWIYAPPLLLLNVVMIASCMHAFQPELPQSIAAFFLMVFSPFGIAALTAFLGLAWKQRDASQPEEVTTSPAGILLMALCLAYVFLQLGLFYLPLHEWHRHMLALMVPLNWAVFAVSGILWLILQGAAIAWPMALASKRMDEAG